MEVFKSFGIAHHVEAEANELCVARRSAT